MRRTDREITDLNEVEAILKAGQVCHMAMVDPAGEPYLLPLNYGMERQGDAFTLYLHAASEGRKLEILAQNPRVCIVVSQHGTVTGGSGPEACGYGMPFASVMAYGDAEILQDANEKEHALLVLMRHLVDDRPWTFSPATLARTTVIRVRLETITAKRKSLAK